MTRVVTRNEIRTTLASWTRGELLPAEVHAWAEGRFANSEYESDDEIVNEILGALDMIDMNLTVAEDVPTLLAVLEIPPEGMEQALEILERHRQGIDVAARRLLLAADPFYSRFCGK